MHRELQMPFKMLFVALAFAGCAADESPVVLPEVVASGKYVDYGAFADVSHVCMGDKLAAWDDYIEELAAFLDVDPPQQKDPLLLGARRGGSERHVLALWDLIWLHTRRNRGLPGADCS